MWHMPYICGIYVPGPWPNSTPQMVWSSGPRTRPDPPFPRGCCPAIAQLRWHDSTCRKRPGNHWIRSPSCNMSTNPTGGGGGRASPQTIPCGGGGLGGSWTIPSGREGTAKPWSIYGRLYGPAYRWPYGRPYEIYAVLYKRPYWTSIRTTM